MLLLCHEEKSRKKISNSTFFVTMQGYKILSIIPIEKEIKEFKLSAL